MLCAALSHSAASPAAPRQLQHRVTAVPVSSSSEPTGAAQALCGTAVLGRTPLPCKSCARLPPHGPQPSPGSRYRLKPPPQGQHPPLPTPWQCSHRGAPGCPCGTRSAGSRQWWRGGAGSPAGQRCPLRPAHGCRSARSDLEDRVACRMAPATQPSCFSLPLGTGCGPRYSQLTQHVQGCAADWGAAALERSVLCVPAHAWSQDRADDLHPSPFRTPLHPQWRERSLVIPSLHSSCRFPQTTPGHPEGPLPSSVPRVWSCSGPGYLARGTPLFQPQAKPCRRSSEGLLQPHMSHSKSQDAGGKQGLRHALLGAGGGWKGCPHPCAHVSPWGAQHACFHLAQGRLHLTRASHPVPCSCAHSQLPLPQTPPAGRAH